MGAPPRGLPKLLHAGAGTQRSLTVARYQGDDRIIGAVLEVEPESKLVLLISRNDGELAMNLVKIR